jgi:NADH-quinone oxidoreductase subunit J
MEANLLYIACVIGAAALYLTLRPGRRGLRTAGALLGLGAFAWLLWAAPGLLQAMGGLGVRPEHRLDGPFVFFLVFSLIAAASAVRMITHDRPVYSALYFVLVVLSSAALFLLLQAEFMAFALIIVYAGAILITYLFVIMLAQQAPTPQQTGAEADYDRLPREPAFACVVGFGLLAVLGNMVFAGVPGLTSRPSEPAIQRRMWEGLNQMPRDLQAAVARVEYGARVKEGAKVEMVEGVARIAVERADGSQAVFGLSAEDLPNNVQRVGLDLVAKFPVSLELAGVILLMAMFGAVVLARKQIELGEDEVREAAGMRRLALHGDEGGAGTAAADNARGGRT